MSVVSKNLSPTLAAICLLVGSLADFLAGSPGDASALLFGALCCIIGAALLPNADFPQTRNNRVQGAEAMAFGLFSLAATAVLAKIAEDVVDLESPRFDNDATRFVHGFDTPSIDVLMRAISATGGFQVIVPLAIVLVAFCWFKGHRPAAVVLIGAMVIEQLAKSILKQVFARPRPTVLSEIAPLPDFSFPSAHAMAAMAIYGTMAVIASRMIPKARTPIFFGATALILLIGLSRVYLGAHWITDVLAGYAAGSAILFAAIATLELLRSPNESEA